MCQNCGCEGITYPGGSDGIGIVSITDNEDGTFTILMSDGSSFISPNYTGPTGPAGANGTNGTNGLNGGICLFAQTAKSFSVADPNVSIDVDTTLLTHNGDFLVLEFVAQVVNDTAGNFTIINIPPTSAPETLLTEFVSKPSKILIKMVLIKEGSLLKGYTFIPNTLQDVTVTNFFEGPISTFEIESDFSAEDACVYNITLTYFKKLL